MIIKSASGRLLTGFNRLMLVRNQVARYAKTAAEEQRAFFEKNYRLRRPMSPHLTIYRLPLNANLSVGHRVTGACLSCVVIGFGLGSLYWTYTGEFDKICQWVKYNVHPHIILSCKAILAFPFVYHVLAGIRHLIWDTGRWLSAPGIQKSSWGLLALAFVLSFALASQ